MSSRLYFLSLVLAGGLNHMAHADTVSEFDAVNNIQPYSVEANKRLHDEYIDTLDVHPLDSDLVVTSGYDSYVRLTDTSDAQNWKVLWEWRKPQQAFLAELPIEFNKSGSLIAFGDYKGRGYLFDSADGSVVFDQFVGEAGDPNYHHINDVYFSDDGRSVFFSRVEKIFEYDISSSKLMSVYEGPGNTSFKGVTLLSDGRLFAANYGTSYVWKRGERTHTKLATFPINLWVNNHNDTTMVRSRWITVQAGFDLFLLDTTTGQVAQKFIAASAPMLSFAFVKNESLLIGCTHFGEIGFYETSTGKVIDQYQLVNETNDMAGCGSLSTSNDGDTIYFIVGRGSLLKMSN